MTPEELSIEHTEGNHDTHPSDDCPMCDDIRRLSSEDSE